MSSPLRVSCQRLPRTPGHERTMRCVPAVIAWAAIVCTGGSVQVFEFTGPDSEEPSSASAAGNARRSYMLEASEAVLFPPAMAEDHSINEFRFFQYEPVVTINACAKSTCLVYQGRPAFARKFKRAAAVLWPTNRLPALNVEGARPLSPYPPIPPHWCTGARSAGGARLAEPNGPTRPARSAVSFAICLRRSPPTRRIRRHAPDSALAVGPLHGARCGPAVHTARAHVSQSQPAR